MKDLRDRRKGTELSVPDTARVSPTGNYQTAAFGVRAAMDHRRSGIALVVVLSFIVLLSILVVGFFSSVSTELVGAKTYSSGVSTQQLSETAVNVVMGQIRTATTLENGAWASQPGMIRVYRNAEAAGSKADSFFKLYSSDNMVLTGGEIQAFNPEDETPVNWPEQPSLFTNLNEPVLAADQNGGPAIKRYPILDPSWAGTTPYDPNAKIEGFAITSEATPGVDRARMPARWIYVLKDGSLTVPQADPNGLATWENVANVPVPTPGNPIVGRIAFWTDDESSKVNINTAGGFVVPKGADENSYAGSFWDMPRAYTTFDLGEMDNDGTIDGTGNITKPGLSVSQPAQHEFQRYPGHPATTSLGLIFRDLFASNPEQLYKFLPRFTPGGSVGGTARPTAPLDPEQPYIRRLYASVDELLFTQKDPSTVPSGHGWRRPTTNETLFTGGAESQLTPEQVDQLRFFLTAQSRSSDLNLYGRPRVALWPIPPLTTAAVKGFHPTPYDRLIAFCATLPGKAYYWRRHSAYQPKAEYDYPRNKELYQYLYDLTSKPVPGVGATFAQKFATDRDQILTEMLDYIRTVNVRQSDEDQNYYSANGMVVPLKFTSPGGVETKGFGRIPTITEAALVFYHGGEDTKKGTKRLRAFLILENFTPGYGYAGLRRPTTPNFVVHEITGLDVLKVGTAEGGAPQELGFPHSGKNVIEYESGATWHGRNTGGPEGFFHTLMPASKKAQIGGNGYPFQSSQGGVEFPINAQGFMFYGGKITINSTLSGTTLQTIELEFPDSGVVWPFPRHEQEFCHYTDPGGFWLGVDGVKPEDRLDFNKRLIWTEKTSSDYRSTGGNNYANRWRQIIQPGDVIRSIEIGGVDRNTYRGDVRLMALEDHIVTKNPTQPVTKPHARYFSENYFKAYSIRTAAGALYDDTARPVIQGRQIGQATFGRLVATPSNYPSDKAGDIPEYLNSGVTRNDGKPGDWDTGMGSFADGPFINKPDEGNVVYKYFDSAQQKYIRTYPYFSWNDALVGATYFSPNRIMPSAVMFGSLPSRVNKRGSWETLVFCPNTMGINHLGNAAAPKDHYFLDLFNMPIVEPYAISEPCSTAGRVNLNYQIMPYTYIHRSSALRAALHSLRVMGVPGSDVTKYKSSLQSINYRQVVDRNETIKSFEDFFSKFATDKNGGFFKSATEICERYLYPKGVQFSPGDTAIKTWWAGMTLSGDNTREKPYADLYPRVTTKSNTYTVHMRVQTLRQGNGLSKDPSQYLRWDERPDAILGEYRGATTIERYIDPNDRRFDANNPETREQNDYVDPDKQSIEAVHRFRVVGVKRFSP